MEKEIIFGDLALAFTTDFEHRYDDKGSGAYTNGSFWHPIAPDGYWPLGSVGTTNYDPISGKMASLCVKRASNCFNDPLAAPKDYELVWMDKGSGAYKNGSCWRPIAPEDYVALGVVFVEGFEKPSLHDVVCVKKTLTESAILGSCLWTDHGSGAKQSIACYEVKVPPLMPDSEYGYFAPNTLVAIKNYKKPTDNAGACCLYLPIPSKAFDPPKKPTLTSHQKPPKESERAIDHVAIVPFTAITDNAKTLEWKVKHSPFYEVVRYTSYMNELFIDNQSAEPQTLSKTITLGISKSISQTFSVNTGISVTTETGVSILGTGGKVSCTLSVELGWSRTTSVEEFREVSVTEQLTAKPFKAAALWTTSHMLKVMRVDGTFIGQELAYETNTDILIDEFPDGSKEKDTPQVKKQTHE